jgi:hypothetical protein
MYFQVCILTEIILPWFFYSQYCETLAVGRKEQI